MKKFDILILDTKPSNPNHYICLAIEEAMKNSPFVNTITKADYSNAIQMAIKNECNFFLAFDGEAIEKNICRRLSKICGLSAVWFTEDPYEIKVNIETADIFDFVFTNDSSSVSSYNKKVHHLPFAGSNLFHFNEIPDVVDSHYKYDIFFAGTAWPNRVSLLSKLVDNTKLKLKIALPTNEHLPKIQINLPQSSYDWRTPITEFCKFANHSKITLFLHREFSTGSGKNKAETPGPRLFEVALAGGFQLVDMTLSEVSDYFEENKDFIGFYSEEDCLKKINYYIANPHERIQIAKNGQNKARTVHTYEKRVERIFQIVSNADHKPFRNAEKVNILQVIHNTTDNTPFGGTEIYCDLIVKGNTPDFNFFTLAPKNSGHFGQILQLRDSNSNLIEEFEYNNLYSSLLLVDEERETSFANILIKYNIHIVHYQHLIGFIPSLLYMSKSLGLKNIVNIHDYHWLCSQFNLINYKNEYCHADKIDIKQCDLCLNHRFGISSGSQQLRRNYFRNLTTQVDSFIFNTMGVKKLFEDTLKVSITSNYSIIPPPITSLSNKRFKDSFNDKIKVAIIGNLAINKGALTFIELIDKLINENIEFHISGFTNKDVEHAIISKNNKNIYFHGPYTVATLPERLKDMDLSLHLSVWPETYCITLSESWHNGLIPIVSNLGALNERVIEGENGFKFQANSSTSLHQAIKKAIQDRDKLQTMRNNILNSKLYSHQNEFVSTMYSHYKNISNEAFLFENDNSKFPFNLRTIYIRPWLNSPVWGLETKDININKSFTEKLIILFRKSINTTKKEGLIKLIKKTLIYLKSRLL